MASHSLVKTEHPVDEKGKLVCGAKRKRGGLCMLGAGYGTDHPGVGRCKWHLGSTASMTKDAARREAEQYAKSLLGSDSGSVDPDEVLLKEVSRAQNAVRHYDREIAKMIDEGVDVSDNRFNRAIYNWNEQRRLLIYVSNLVVRAGIAKRSIEIQEMQAAAVLAAVLSVLSSPELALDPEKIDFARRQVATNLRDLAMGAEQRAEMAQEMVRVGRV